MRNTNSPEMFLYSEGRGENHEEARCMRCGSSEDLSTIVGDQAICIHCVTKAADALDRGARY